MKNDRMSLWGKYKLQQNVEKIQKFHNERKKKYKKKKNYNKKINLDELSSYTYKVYSDQEKYKLLESTVIREYTTVNTSESKFILLAGEEDDITWFNENKSKFNSIKICLLKDGIGAEYQQDKLIGIEEMNRRDILIILHKNIMKKVNFAKNLTLVPKEIFIDLKYQINICLLDQYLFEKPKQYKRYKQKEIWAFSSISFPCTIESKIINNVYVENQAILLRNFNTAMKCTDFFAKNIVLYEGAISTEEILQLIEYAPVIISLINNLIIYNPNFKKMKFSKIAIEYEGVNYVSYQGNKMNCSPEFKKQLIASCGDKSLTYITDEVFEQHVNTRSKAIKFDSLHLKNEYADLYEYSVFNQTVYKTSNIDILYIYDIERHGDIIRIYTFENGYRRKKSNFSLIDSKGKPAIKVDNPKGAKFYSKYSSDFKENFYYYEFEFKKIEEIVPINLKTNEKVNFKFLKFLQNGCIRNGIGIKRRYGKRIILFDEVIKRKSKFEIECQSLRENVYMFVDRGTKADDNAEHLYRYYMKRNNGEQIFYVLSKESKDWTRLQNEGFNLVEYLSDEHKKLYLTAEYIISSHIAKRIINPFKNSIKYEYLRKGKFIFLQHGLMLSEHRGFLDKYSFPLDLFVCSAEEEADMVKQFSEYSTVKVTGLARYDALNCESKGYILYAPSWNILYKNNFIGSKYHVEVNKVLSSKAINTFLEENNLKIKLVLHPEFMKFNKYFQNSKNVTIVEESELDYNKFISEANGIITDYSSILFDFIYQGKPVIQYKPYNLHHPPTKLKEHKKYVYEPCNLDELEEVLNKIDLKCDTKRSEPNTFFKHVDHKNCERIYNEIKKI